MELEHGIAVVTGGSRGIGLAVATELARGGAKVALLARDGARAMEAAADLPGGDHLGCSCDVADTAAVSEAVRHVTGELGGPTILVNNAGITRDSIVLRMKDEMWDEVIDVNLKGTFNMSKAVIRGMLKRRDGVILNISSVVGLAGNPGQVNYAASKAGILGLTKSLAREVASRGIRCNAIAPGYIETEMTAALTESQTQTLLGRIPLGRLGVPGDVAGLARFLAGPAGRYITGQVVVVDGGMTM